ncbi:MAG: DNA primase [Lachnospiraceae bacterium]|nr:DNA primase [Lachnospiraceae bacterium]
MSVFQEIKDSLSLRQVVEHYGLHVGRNGKAQCPFHSDKTPSLQLYEDHYHCFGCNAHGDAIDYVGRLYGLSPIDSAQQIIDDFSLAIEIRPTDPFKTEQNRNRWRKEKADRDNMKRIQEHFHKWCSNATDQLLQAQKSISFIKEHFSPSAPSEIFSSKDYAIAVDAEPLIGYWLDILCLGTKQERSELFINARKEVEIYVERIRNAIQRRVAADRRYSGYRVQQCG